MSTRKVNVIEAREIKAGETNGKSWAIYAITATTPEGEPIDLTLKSFERLDGLVEVDVEKQTHEKYGTSYMLKRAGGGGSSQAAAGARLGPKVDELRDRLDHLESIVTRLVDEVSGLKQLAHQAASEVGVGAASHYGSPPAEPDRSPGTFGADDDIPF